MLNFLFEYCKKTLFYDIILNNCSFNIYGDDIVNIIKKMKLNKHIKFLKNHKFTIDQNQILDGKLRMLPDIKLLYMQSKSDPNIFEVFYILCIDRDDGKGERYYFSIPFFNYPIILNDDKCITEVYSYLILGSWNNYDKRVYSFAQNCLPSDIYEYDDFINILKGINDEITDYLYKNGIYRVDTENCINRVESNSEFEMLSEDTVKMLIKKVHREYMDGKVSGSVSDVNDHKV